MHTLKLQFSVVYYVISVCRICPSSFLVFATISGNQCSLSTDVALKITNVLNDFVS